MMREIFRKWTKNPAYGAFLVVIIFALILFPYWWLADQWSRTVILDPSTQFTITSTTFLLILAIIDCAFLIRYYQIQQHNDLELAAHEVKKGAENYRALIENAPFPIVITKLDDNGILVMNKEAADLFGIHPFERSGKSVRFQFITATEHQKILGILQEKQHITDFIVSFETRTKELVYASLSANIIDYLGEKAVFTAFVNVSERVRLEKEIIKREEKFSTVFHEVPNPLMILSETDSIVDINKGCELYFSFTREGFIGRNISDMAFFPDLDKEFFSIQIDRERIPVETIVHLPDGVKRYVILHIRPIIIQDSRHTLLLIQDIDEIKRSQNAITQANNQIAILNSITRHDILNRVMVVISYCELLRKKVTDNPEVTLVSNVIKSGEDIQALVDFTRQYQDLGIHPPQWQNVKHVMKRRSINSLLGDISVSFPGEPIEIYADPMFEKVLYNLVDNSLRHGERVTEISLSYEKSETGLIFHYIDNGVGISYDDKKEIFTKGFGKNTGLGLFLIREILRLTGIMITENGIPGQGVRFDMKIPTGAFRDAIESPNNPKHDSE